MKLKSAVIGLASRAIMANNNIQSDLNNDLKNIDLETASISNLQSVNQI